MFKDYNMGQLVLPMDFSDLIPEDHVSRVVHEMIERLNDQIFLLAYDGGGRPPYHPKMMTKVVLYSHTKNGSSVNNWNPHWKWMYHFGSMDDIMPIINTTKGI